MSVAEFTQKARGEKGSDVELTVKPYKYLLPLPRTIRIARESLKPFVFKARTTSGETFDITVGGLNFFAGDPPVPPPKDRKYGAVFDDSIPFSWILHRDQSILRSLRSPSNNSLSHKVARFRYQDE